MELTSSPQTFEWCVYDNTQKMLAEGQYPTQHTAGAFLDALKSVGQTDRCLGAFSEMMDKGLDLGDVCFNIVVSSLVEVGRV